MGLSIHDLVADRKHRLPRVWSNRELARVAPHLDGDVVNVSGWKDIDKEGRTYKSYFTKARSYSITNFRADARGFQGVPGEIFLDLEQPLAPELNRAFDVAYNHTVLEHVFEVETAFGNLCDMSRDVVVLVVPFLQPMHTDYGDYWRFTPLAVKRLFEKRGFDVVYSSFNRHWFASIYLFFVASRDAARWAPIFGNAFSYKDLDRPPDGLEGHVGTRAIPNLPRGLWRRLKGR